MIQKSKCSKTVKRSTESNPANSSNDADKISVKRYFDDETKRPTNQNSALITSAESESPISVSSTENVEQIIVVRRPILGSLPSYIPIG